MWYGHIPEPFEKKTRVALLITFIVSVIIGFFFPPVFFVSLVTGYLSFCQLVTTVHPSAPDSYDEVGNEASSIFKWFIIISCSLIVILTATFAIMKFVIQ